MKISQLTYKYICPVFYALLLIPFCLSPSIAQEKEKTYSISLVKTAETEKDIHKIGDKKVLTETHTVRKGEHLWQLLREKGLLKGHNLPELLSVLKQLNSSFANLNLIHPGEELIIPLKIVPVSSLSLMKNTQPEIEAPIKKLKDIKLEYYTVKQGDSLIRIAVDQYDIPANYLYNDYLKMVKKLNPSIKDINTIYPGQKIKLPIYSPRIVRSPIKPEIPIKTENRTEIKKTNTITDDLEMIFAGMGEEWINTGEHFIPFKSGGQIDLKAVSFPIINLQNGLRVIVDLKDKLTDRMTGIIKSSWQNYRVIHLKKEDDLKSSLNKILSVCGYAKIRRQGEPLQLSGNIPLKITGDWIITRSGNQTDDKPLIYVINILTTPEDATSCLIKDYVKGLGIEVIDCPPGENGTEQDPTVFKALKGCDTPSSLVESLLKLDDREFSTQLEIPVFQSRKADLKLTIKADFFLRTREKDAIIDLTGFDKGIISFLKDHHFLLLSLAADKDPFSISAKTLEFLDVQYNPGPHLIMAASRDNSRNIRLSIPGIVFKDSHGKPIIITPHNLPDKIRMFLSLKGYKVLPLSFS
ncbi:MAG: LysM peptidoglycan-binding domain-containing protein [Deltaproteobacteria bacterium]|nr:LysM peptidoglycan-binding domain-containing protein [Deltaproteobacteria bacterium]